MASGSATRNSPGTTVLWCPAPGGPVPVRDLADLAALEARLGMHYDGAAVEASADTPPARVAAVFAEYDALVAKAGPYVRFTEPVIDGLRIVAVDRGVLAGRPTVRLHDPRHVVLARLRLCRDLDEVLAVDTPIRLVAQLFGANGTRALIEPLGDALLAGLATGHMSMSSIALASAASELLDASRLAVVLGWDDEGFDLVPANAPTDIREDLQLVLGGYKDRDRRLRLLRTLWDDVVARQVVARDRRAMVAEIEERAAPALRGVRKETRSLAEFAERGSRRSATMIIEWHVQQFIRAETDLVRIAASGRAAAVAVASWLDGSVPTKRANRDRIMKAGSDAIVEFARLRGVVTEIGRRISKDRAKWGEAMRRASALVFAANFDGLNENLRLLILYATGSTDTDAQEVPWLERLRVYRGGSATLDHVRDVGDVPPTPRPPNDLAAAVAQAAQLVRLGAELPEKPANWQTLITKVAAPYYVNEVLAIGAPAWVEKLHLQPLADRDLMVRVPRDMSELSRWADYMGNCIASIFGDDVAKGRRIILGLFRGDELMYNAGVEAGTGTVWEVNSRFNEGGVPDDVERAIRDLVRTVRPRSQVPAPRRGPLRPRSQGSRPSGVAPALRTQAATLANELRRFDPVVAQWLAPLGAIAERSGAMVEASPEESRWIADVAALTRQDPDVVGCAFDEWLADPAADTTGFWELLMCHPLDRPNTMPVDMDVSLREMLGHVRDGSDRARLSRPLRVLSFTAIEHAWRLAGLQTQLRAHVASIIRQRPLALSAALRSDRTRRARWALGLVYVGAVECDPQPPADRQRVPVRDLVWLDLNDADLARTAWREAYAVAPGLIEALAVSCGVSGVDGDDPVGTDTVAEQRIAARREPLRCPRAWFGRR